MEFNINKSNTSVPHLSKEDASIILYLYEYDSTIRSTAKKFNKSKNEIYKEYYYKQKSNVLPDLFKYISSSLNNYSSFEKFVEKLNDMKPYRLQSEEVKDMLYKLGYFDYFVQLSTKHDYYSQLFINMPTIVYTISYDEGKILKHILKKGETIASTAEKFNIPKRYACYVYLKPSPIARVVYRLINGVFENNSYTFDEFKNNVISSLVKFYEPVVYTLFSSSFSNKSSIKEVIEKFVSNKSIIDSDEIIDEFDPIEINDEIVKEIIDKKITNKNLLEKFISKYVTYNKLKEILYKLDCEFEKASYKKEKYKDIKYV